MRCDFSVGLGQCIETFPELEQLARFDPTGELQAQLWHALTACCQKTRSEDRLLAHFR